VAILELRSEQLTLIRLLAQRQAEACVICAAQLRDLIEVIGSVQPAVQFGEAVEQQAAPALCWCRQVRH